MQVVNFKEALLNLDAVFNKVYLDNEEVVMHKDNGQNIVMIPFDEYNAMKETAYLFSSPKNKEHLLNSLKELKMGNIIKKDIIE